ncbi:hypothetical protein ACTFIR_005753 [Dictyostelium discoideum]
MFIQPQKDNGLTCQTRFQVKSRKECSRTNSINYVSRIENRFGINEASCSQRKEEKCHQGNKKLFKARLLLPKKTCWFKGKANRIEGCSHSIPPMENEINPSPFLKMSILAVNAQASLDVKEINIIVLSTLSSSGIDISKFKPHSPFPLWHSAIVQ